MMTLKKHFPKSVQFLPASYDILGFDNDNCHDTDSGQEKVMGELRKIKEYLTCAIIVNMKSELQKLSQQVKKEADLLLNKTELIELLEKYGDVHKRGSYELDLMIDGDIDIYIIAKQFSKKPAIDLLNKLIFRNDFRGYMFYDFVKRRKKGFPKGYYLGLKTKTNSRKWKIDIWLMKSMDNVSDRFMKKISQGLDEKKRDTILKFKKIIKERQIDLPSFVIYDAVVMNEISDMQQLSVYANRAGYKI